MTGAKREHMISVSGVDKFYRDFQALRDVDLQVKRGERVVFFGPSDLVNTALSDL